jgi:hypothetical protein
MMSLIISLLHSDLVAEPALKTEYSCNAKKEPSFITPPPDLPQTLPDILLTTNHKRAIIRFISKYNRK